MESGLSSPTRLRDRISGIWDGAVKMQPGYLSKGPLLLPVPSWEAATIPEGGMNPQAAHSQPRGDKCHLQLRSRLREKST